MTISGGMLNGKVVVVTGGAGLLGRVFVKTVVEHGGIGIIADINDESGNKVMRELQDDVISANIDFVTLDITSKESIAVMIRSLTKKYGKIDALVNNAYPRNRNYGKKFEDVSFEDFCDNLNMHLGGYFLMSQQFAVYFKKQGHGNIINMSSIYGIMAPRFEAYENTTMTMPVEYAAIKSSIIHLTKYIAKYYKGCNIRVNSISPGGVIDKQPASFLERYTSHCLNKGMLSIEDLKGTLIYLLSDASQFVNGQNIIIDDGYSL
jgi:NAD(P)-dependent dehydrogenase (short-subunit alcohol dehydrogenase family)